MMEKEALEVFFELGSLEGGLDSEHKGYSDKKSDEGSD